MLNKYYQIIVRIRKWRKYKVNKIKIQDWNKEMAIKNGIIHVLI